MSVTCRPYDLGMSNSTPQPPAPPTLPVARVVDRDLRRALVSDLPVELRELRRLVLTDTMANGVPVRPSALCVVLAAHLDLAETPLRFTAAHVEELLWCGLSEFCEDVGFEMPAGCPEALHAVLAVASAHGLFDNESEPAAALFGAFHQLAAS